MKNSTIIVIAFLFAFATDSNAQSGASKRDAFVHEKIEYEITLDSKDAVLRRISSASVERNRVSVSKKQLAPVKREAHDLKKIQALPGKLD